MLLSNCADKGSKKSKYLKEQEITGLLSTIGKVPLVGLLLI